MTPKKCGIVKFLAACMILAIPFVLFNANLDSRFQIYRFKKRLLDDRFPSIDTLFIAKSISPLTNNRTVCCLIENCGRSEDDYKMVSAIALVFIFNFFKGAGVDDIELMHKIRCHKAEISNALTDKANNKNPVGEWARLAQDMLNRQGI